MARRRQPEGRKRRTREHILADLSVNYLERKVLECGFCIERVQNDYGIDVDVTTFDIAGEIEGGFIRFQLKATDRLVVLEDGERIAQRVSTADLKAWLFELYPVILIVYDAQKNRAFWLDMQDEVRKSKIEQSGVKTITLHVPLKQQLTEQSILDFRALKNQLIAGAMKLRRR